MMDFTESFENLHFRNKGMCVILDPFY
jgi:hypothetical protein